MADNVYDVLILGGGAAGMTAGIYASRSRLSVALVEKGYPGGQVMMCETIENFPGFPNGTNGFELASAMKEQAEKFGTEIKLTEIEKVELDGPEKIAYTTDGEIIRGKSVILCLGAHHRRLMVPGEADFLGKGVSYCAVCDGALFAGKKLAVVGGGDTAVGDAVYLTRFASEVHIVHRRDAFRAQKILQERALANPKIKVHWDSAVEKISGGDFVEAVTLKTVKSDESKVLDVDAVFVLVGLVPNTGMLQGHVEMDPEGYILTDENMQTSIPGVFAVGDARHKLLRQIVTACSDGAIAAAAAEKFVDGL